jgi:hypothetical protein
LNTRDRDQKDHDLEYLARLWSRNHSFEITVLGRLRFVIGAALDGTLDFPLLLVSLLLSAQLFSAAFFHVTSVFGARFSFLNTLRHLLDGQLQPGAFDSVRSVGSITAFLIPRQHSPE